MLRIKNEAGVENNVFNKGQIIQVKGKRNTVTSQGGLNESNAASRRSQFNESASAARRSEADAANSFTSGPQLSAAGKSKQAIYTEGNSNVSKNKGILKNV